MNPITKELFVKALECLDALVPGRVELVMGGAMALVVAYGETEGTYDVDAVPTSGSLSSDELKPYLITVAENLNLPKDWVNFYFATYMNVLPSDFRARLREVFKGAKIRCLALGPEDLLIMKLMAGRNKDERHIRRLMKRDGINLSIVGQRLDELTKASFPKGGTALDHFEELKGILGVEES